MIRFSSARRQHFLDQQPQASHPGLALVGRVVGHQQEVAETSGLLLQVTRKNDARGYERFKDLFEAIVAYNE